MLKKPELVIFDMDGTMLDTEMLSIKGWEAAVRQQVPDVPHELFLKTFHSMIGTTYESCKKISQTLMPSFDFDKGHKASYAYMDDHIKKHGIPIKVGLFELLDRLEQLGIKKCVATSTIKERATHKLTLAGVAHRFDAIVGGDEVENSKPNPDIFLKAASICGVAPENCLVLEDSAAGTEGGYRAGMQVIVIPDLLPPTQAMRDMATAVCKDMHEVAALVG
ncbi:MAG: HAD family phosphatase [Defluviitaleaceae bacterium]|nr:HAD family phosphatase [Defluviitaleaceae bacterium]